MISRGYVDHCFMLCSHGPSKSNANLKESVKSQLFDVFDVYQLHKPSQFVISRFLLCQILSFI